VNLYYVVKEVAGRAVMAGLEVAPRQNIEGKTRSSVEERKNC